MSDIALLSFLFRVLLACFVRRGGPREQGELDVELILHTKRFFGEVVASIRPLCSVELLLPHCPAKVLRPFSPGSPSLANGPR